MKQEIYFILDKNWNTDLYAISRDRHIWICQSPSNDILIKDVWEKDRGEYSENKGVTSFEIRGTVDDAFYDFIGVIDEHHKGYGFGDGWGLIRVFGLDSKMVDIEELEGLLRNKIKLQASDSYIDIIKVAD